MVVSCQPARDPDTGLWPPIEPYATGYLQVSEIHELYYELVGNPEGKPVFVLHGGPGGSCQPVMRQFFDPGKFRVVLFDQRGSGRSHPFASINENNTWELVNDIEKLRKHLGISEMMLVGGSWGSTLALAYSEKHPTRVTDMVLRGIFTATQEEIDHFYHGGTAGIFPDAYGELLDALPHPERRPLPDYLLELLQDEDAATRKHTANAWLKYEWRISDIHVDTLEINKWIAQNDAYAFSLIENYYMAHGCFFEQDQLWKDLPAIKGIRLSIVHGRFDMPCQVSTAFRLHQALPGSQLTVVEAAGHGGSAITKAVTDAILNHQPE